MEASKTDNDVSRGIQIINSLKETNSQAIQKIARKIGPDVKSLVHRMNLPKEDIEELIHDSILILISSIQNGKFVNQGYHPGAYAMAVVRKLVANKMRSRKKPNLELNDELLSDFNTEEYLNSKERQSVLADLLSKLGTVCRKVVELKYFDNYRDKEVVALKLTGFSTTDSLKSKRSQCMKELSTLAKKSGISYSL